MVDPAGLKPALRGLKGRCSVTRAPDRKEMAVAEGLEPSITGLTIRRLTNLATPQKNWLREQESNLRWLAYETNELPLLYSRNVWMRRRELNSHQLVYKTSALDPIELRRKNLVDWEGVKPSREVCRTSMLSVTSPARNFGSPRRS